MTRETLQRQFGIGLSCIALTVIGGWAGERYSQTEARRLTEDSPKVQLSQAQQAHLEAVRLHDIAAGSGIVLGGLALIGAINFMAGRPEDFMLETPAEPATKEMSYE
jgi:hypothetical protein